MYDAGTAALTITVSFRGVQKEVQKTAKMISTEISKAIHKGLDDGYKSGDPTKSGTEQGEKFGRSFADTAKRRIKAAMKTLPDIELKADSSDVDKNLHYIKEQLKELSGKTIGVDIDDMEAIKKLHDLQRRLEGISRSSGSVKVSADTAAASAELQKLAGEVDKLASKNPHIKAEVDDARAKVEMDLLGLKADRLGRKRETIHVGVDEPNLKRSRGLLGSFGAGVADIFGSLGKVVTTIGGLFGDTAQQAMQAGKGMQEMGTQAAGMAGQMGGGGGGGAGGAVGAVLQFTVQLYKMAGIVVGVEGLVGALTIAIGALETALAALPGIIFGAVSAIAVLVLAFKNVGTAIQDGWGGKSKQFKKDLKNLTPQARRFAEAIVALKKPFKQLEDVVAKNFFGPFAKDIKPLAKRLIPSLAKGLGYVAKSLGQGIDVFLKWLNSAPTIMLITQLLGGMSGVFDKLMKALIPFTDGFLNLVDAALPFLTQMATWLSKVADEFDRWTKNPKNMAILEKAFQNLMILLPGVVKLAAQLAPLFLKIFADPKTQKAIKDMFATLSYAIITLGPLLPQFVEIFDAIMLALQVAMPMIKAAIQILLRLTLDVLFVMQFLTVQLYKSALWIKGPFVNFFKAVGAWFAGPFVNFFKAIGRWFAGPFVNFFKAIGRWFAGPFVDFFKAIGRWFAGPFVNFFKAIGRWFTGPFVNFFKSIGRWFTGPFVNFFKAIGRWFTGPFVNFFKSAWGKIQSWTGTLVGTVKRLWGGLVGRVKDLWHDLLNNVVYKIRDFFTKTIPGWTGTLAGKVKSLWGGIVGRVKGLWHDLLTNVVYKIRDFFTKTIPGWTGTLAGKVKSLWGSIVGRVKTLWHDLLTNVVYKVRDFFTKSIPGWTGTLSGKVKSLWGSMVGRVKEIWKDFKSSVVYPIRDFFTKKIPEWSGTLVGKVKDNFKSLGSAVRKIWNDIKNYVKGPVKGILGIAHDMFHAVEVVGDKFKIKEVKNAATAAAATMTTWRNKVNGWAVGGPVHGPGTGTSDDIPAYLSNNEHVWTAKETRAVGGHQRMIELRKAALRGDIHPAYAKGGPVTHIGAPGLAVGGSVGNGGGNYVPNIITAIARKFQSGVRMTSGYRSYMTEGHPDFHNAGLAADLVSPNMDKLAAAWYKVPSYLLEEIHTRAGSLSGWYVKNGKRVPGSFYGAATQAGHRDHVHIAMTKASATSLLGKLTGKSGASLLDEIKAFAGSLAGGPVSTFDWATDFYDKYFKKYVDKIGSFGSGDKNSGIVGDLAGGVFKKVADGTMDWVKDKLSDLLSAGGVDANGNPYAKGIPTSGTLAGWIKKAMKLTGVYGRPGWYAKLYGIAMRESRGDPTAINNYDSNAAKGIPSKGVMQIIPPMYKKFHQKGTSWNMYDPISNIAAAINYIKGVYGSPQNTPANYYDVGGILKPGATLAVNHTGRNEYVLRNDQVQRLAQQGASMAAAQLAAITGSRTSGPGLVVNAKHVDLDRLDYQRLSAKIDRQRVLDGLLTP